jgi:hypothetical protein
LSGSSIPRKEDRPLGLSGPGEGNVTIFMTSEYINHSPKCDMSEHNSLLAKAPTKCHSLEYKTETTINGPCKELRLTLLAMKILSKILVYLYK